MVMYGVSCKIQYSTSHNLAVNKQYLFLEMGYLRLIQYRLAWFRIRAEKQFVLSMGETDFEYCCMDNKGTTRALLEAVGPCGC